MRRETPARYGRRPALGVVGSVNGIATFETEYRRDAGRLEVWGAR